MPGKADQCARICATAFKYLYPADTELGVKHLDANSDGVDKQRVKHH